MGISDAIHRKDKTAIEKEKDFYQTPQQCVDVLIYHLLNVENYGIDTTVLDPCMGEGMIYNTLIKHFPFTEGIDKYATDKNQRCNYFEYICGLKELIIMNPPYSQKDDFINKAMREAENVYCILPKQVDNYISVNEKYLDVPEYAGKINLYPKIIMSEKPQYKQGGLTAYAWYHWNKKDNGKRKYDYFYDMRKIEQYKEELKL